jgi:hypothetical protein
MKLMPGTALVHIRMDARLIARLDAVVARHRAAMPGVNMTRSDCIRAACELYCGPAVQPAVQPVAKS